MAYDWHGEIVHARFSAAWFDDIDKRFIHGARPFATGEQPSDRIMPLRQLSGKRVLEIGCGIGLHCETIIRAGAENPPFDNGAFDFVWSWGVIHHASRTAWIVREIARVLRPDGETRVMVYNLRGCAASH